MKWALYFSYSTIQDLQVKQTVPQESVADSESFLSTKYVEHDSELSQQVYPQFSEQCNPSTIDKEPLYASVNKEVLILFITVYFVIC